MSMSMDTLHTPFYEKMVGSVYSGFSYLVVISESIEHGTKSKKVAGIVRGQTSMKAKTYTFIANVGNYYHGPVKYHLPPIYQQSLSSTPYYPYVAAITPIQYSQLLHP